MAKTIERGWPEPSSAAAKSYVPVTKADADLADGPCRGLLVGTAGTANLREADGTERANVPLVAGYNPLVVRRVKPGGTADSIWALY
ncbi:spike base protein, RCAP_Rcc01079 family [Flaviflagellibacter deserti]|uniref:Uncharacterized protein n=1 Tax=Flaviflagellibacter deserti TaxID=2267266 RepID=A0ABV9Z036_9HYPH